MKRFLVNTIQFEKKFRSYIFLVLIFLLYAQLYLPLIEKLLIYKIAPYLKINNTNFGDIVFGIIFIGALFSLIIKVEVSFWKRKPKIDDIFWPITVISAYSIHRFYILKDSSWLFQSFKWIWFLKYSDGLVLLGILLIYNPKSYLRERKKLDGIPELYEDNFNQKNGGIDIFKRTGYAKYISKLILNQKSKTTFAIGIRGSWGSGKSVFLKKIENEIYNSIKIRFNPWMSKSTEDVLSDFFKILIDKTSNFDSGLSKSFRKYYSSLINLDEGFSKKLFSTFGIIKDESKSSLEQQQKQIINLLDQNKLKIIIFIDDLDRLNADEILSVLKLIRNSFNFPNTFFLVAYDDKYITHTLRKRIDNPEKFLEKIFQLDIDLPSFPIDLVQNQLIELLIINKTDNQKNKISEAIRIIGESQILLDTIKNLRDAIRFANSFNHIYQKKETEVDLFDFILLELLKIKNRTIYNEVRNSLISFSEVEYIELPKNLFNENDPVKFIPTKRIDAKNSLYPLLDMLFNRTNNYDEVKTVRMLGNSIRYFSDDLFGIIPYTDFEKYKSNTFDDFKNLIDIQHKKNNLDELANKILRINLFVDQFAFFNLNKGLLYICNLQNNYNYTITIYANLKTNYLKIKALIPDQNEFEKYLENLFSSEIFDALAESQVIGDALSISLEKNKQQDLPDFNIELLKKILVKNLKRFIENHATEFNNLVFDIYYKIIDKKMPDKVIINPEANSILKQYILLNQATYFKEWLIRPKFYGNFDSNIYVLEPFIEQYLKYEEFERLLFNQNSSLEVLQLQSFFAKYKKNGFSEAEYSPLRLELISDNHTIFTHSPDYTDLKEGESIMKPDKLAPYSNQFEILSYANWISHIEKLSMGEQEKGGVYCFKKEFNLKGLEKNIKSAKIYFLVDDYLRFEINDKIIDREFAGFAGPLHELDIKEHLTKNENKIVFNVRNALSDKITLEKDPDANPYDFIYKIIIDIE